MKKITLKEAYQILEDASAVIINDGILTYPSLWELKDDDTNGFLYIEWDDEGEGCHIKFNEGDNQEVEVVGSSMFLYANGDEDPAQITILTTKELE
jgi:hypothetical protein